MSLHTYTHACPLTVSLPLTRHTNIHNGKVETPLFRLNLASRFWGRKRGHEHTSSWADPSCIQIMTNCAVS